jgi:uncharacterized membrane protein
VTDQAALHGVLKKVRDLGMPLLSVNPVRPGKADGSPISKDDVPEIQQVYDINKKEIKKNENEGPTMTNDKVSVPINKRTASSAQANWLVPAALIALSFIPVAAGIARLAGLAGGATITPENARFFEMPLPVVIHILGASIFCILGAFQFVPGLRRGRPSWHRVAGRILIPCGLAAGLSGLWMTQFYPLSPHLQGDLLYGFRILIGSAMVMFIALSFSAIRRRDIARHRAWMIRGYAIAQGAGTQALVSLLWFIIFGEPGNLVRDLLLIAGWIINLGVAEWIIRANRFHQTYNRSDKQEISSIPLNS